LRGRLDILAGSMGAKSFIVETSAGAERRPELFHGVAGRAPPLLVRRDVLFVTGDQCLEGHRAAHRR
jgi:hypothetical protein